MNTFNLTIAILMVSNSILTAQSEDVLLWNNDIPGSITSKSYVEKQVFINGILDKVSNVTAPTLSIFIPNKPNGTSVVICPGGGYTNLSINKEGFKVAEWLNTLGITAFVLKYRLPNDTIMIDKSIGPLQDAQEAVRYVRRNAIKYKLKTDKVGILGFSAGGHLAATLSTHYDDIVYEALDSMSAKPDFAILVYPVISMDKKIAHSGSRNKLLGKSPSEDLIFKYSNEKQINGSTPPTFLVHATDDKSVPVENSIQYFLSLKENGVSTEMHIYQNGKHGFGLGIDGTSKFWTKQCEDWLSLNKFTHK